jgi:poly(3-hydroxybutyrate) depolymerase
MSGLQSISDAETARRWPAAQDDRPSGSEFDISEATIDGRKAHLIEQRLIEWAFGRLLHFSADHIQQRPRVLLAAPLSGVQPTFLYDMILGMSPDHDVYCLTWRDAAEVPIELGSFGLEDNITYLVEALRYLGGGTHVIGLCQSAFPTAAATAILAEDPARPATLTLIGGKLDTRINPTRIDRLARSLPLEWFENYVITTVPAFRQGHGRRVYPGSIEMMMLSTYLLRNCASGGEILAKIVHDDGVDPAGHSFIKSFFSTVDVPAEFFLDTIAHVFHRSDLSDGQLMWRATKVLPEVITETALLTIEGEEDDISGRGQTQVAHDLCPGIAAHRRGHFLCPHAGHLGLYYGTSWRQEVLPRIRQFIGQTG